MPIRNPPNPPITNPSSAPCTASDFWRAFASCSSPRDIPRLARKCMCPSSTRASSRSLAVWMALPRSGNRKYILRLMLVLLSETRLADRSYPAAPPKSSQPCRDTVKSPPKLARQSLANVSAARGKSGLHRAGCWVTPRRRKATNRATETSLVGLDVARERHVKVSFPRQGTGRRTRPLLKRSDNKGETRQPPPGATSNRRTTTWLAESAGRWLEPRGNPGPRGMTVHDRTRLIGQLHFFLRVTTGGRAKKNGAGNPAPSRLKPRAYS